MKDHRIEIRISSEQKDMLKELQLTFASVFNIGYDKVTNDQEVTLKKNQEYHKKMYDSYTKSLKKHRQLKNDQFQKLDELYDNWWILQPGRDSQHYSEEDIETLNMQLKKKGLEKFTATKVIKYWKDRKDTPNDKIIKR